MPIFPHHIKIFIKEEIQTKYFLPVLDKLQFRISCRHIKLK